MTAHSEAQDLLNELRDQGFKITGPRSQVLEYLAGRDENFTAEELAAALAPIGRATVYRTIKLLQEQGLLCRVIMSDGSVAYRLSNEAHHHHLVCITCGAIQDVHLSDVEPALSRIRESTDFDIVSHRIELYGVCPLCKAARR